MQVLGVFGRSWFFRVNEGWGIFSERERLERIVYRILCHCHSVMVNCTDALAVRWT